MEPVLLYDGDCGFCKAWLGYWQAATGGRIRAEPYQSAAARFPQIPVERFRRSVCLALPGDRFLSGAHAVFHSLGGRLLWAYRHVPVFAAASESAYRAVARNRAFFWRATVAIWGREPRPPLYRMRPSAAIAAAAFLAGAVLLVRRVSK